MTAAFVAASATATAQVTMTIDASRRGPLISPYQYGLFFEEINHAGDGGLYAELVRNRNFAEGLSGWTPFGGAQLSLVTEGLLNTAQKQALDINTTGATAAAPMGVANQGFWGISVKADSTYNLSFFAKGDAAYKGTITVQLRSHDGQNVLGEALAEGDMSDSQWNRFTARIKATATDKQGQLVLSTSHSGHLCLDVVSLFPYTWKNRPNGVRPDLAQLLADTKPSFLRFPGGCYIEGTGSYDNAFQWKRTIGPIEERPGHLNKHWSYWSSDGLGFDEYLQLCEDLGAAPMYVVNVGLGHEFTLTLKETEALVQDALDALEYANGDVSTKWGALRAANGHPDPYNIRFVEIGNENYQANASQQSQDYAERYYMFYKAIKEKYPDIVTIGNVEAWGTDNPTWRNPYPVEVVDEHYYRSYSWMRQNYKKYDGYPRTIQVYNGEYAANASGTYGKYGNMNSALGEAIYMMGMERNSDVCTMASFAPIFMHESDPCWPYDMIHFNSADHFVTPSYYVQQLMNTHLGQQNLLWTEQDNTVEEGVESKIGVGTWQTQARYDDVVVTDLDGNPLCGDDFSAGIDAWTIGDGTWQVILGVLNQSSTAANCTALLTQPLSTDKYIYKVRARKVNGNEGFLIIFNYKDAANYTWWNVGGWGNSKHGIEHFSGGSKTTLTTAAGKIENNHWYDLEVRVDGSQVQCSINGSVVHQFVLPEKESSRALYQSVQIDEERGELILKVANPNDKPQQLALNLKGMTAQGGSLVRLASASGTDENTMDNPDNVKPVYESLEALQLNRLDIPAYSLNIYRIKVDDIAAAGPEECPAYTAEDEGKFGYLYAHMHTTKEISCYALSTNGHYWRDLFNSEEAFDTKKFTSTGGMRDAFVLRTQDGRFMLAGTDMTSRLGWSSNHKMSFMLSNDLVHWDKFVSIDLESEENMKALGLTDPDDMKAAWAPQILFDPVSGKYVAYYSVGFPDYHRIYYSLFDENLENWTLPQLFFDPGFDVIDADIVWNDVDKHYQMVFKREGDRVLSMATAPYLVPTGQESTTSRQWTIVEGFGIDEPGQSIEAPSQFRFIGNKTWKLGYEKYSNGYNYRMMDLDEHGHNPSNRNDIQGKLAPQHGSFVKLTEREYRHLETWEQVVYALDKVRRLHAARPEVAYQEAIAKAEYALNTNGDTFDDNQQAMAEAFKALSEVQAKVSEELLAIAREGKAVDLTPLIENADFAFGSAAWEAAPAFTAANGVVAEYFNTTFDFSQTLQGLPKGSYALSVSAFYRMGSNSVAMAAWNGGTYRNLVSLYAGDNEVEVMGLYDESASRYTQSPYTYPDNVTAANTAFNTDNYYVNTLRFTLEADTDLRLGMRKTVAVDKDWCCFDNFTLRFLGSGSAVTDIVSSPSVSSDRWYNLNGQVVSGEPSVHGIYVHGGKKVVK